jgi:fumarate reductase flavoprotein subunit
MFFKEPHSLRPLQLAPFYAVELRAAIIAVPHVGLRINNSAQVMSEDETAIPRLYAAGSAAGNVLGDQYLGGGISIANAIVYGRIAGRSAAIEALSRTS